MQSPRPDGHRYAGVVRTPCISPGSQGVHEGGLCAVFGMSRHRERYACFTRPERALHTGAPHTPRTRHLKIKGLP